METFAMCHSKKIWKKQIKKMKKKIANIYKQKCGTFYTCDVASSVTYMWHIYHMSHVLVEQDVLMSRNASGKLEDLTVVVCVSSCLKLVNSLLKIIQVHLNI